MKIPQQVSEAVRRLNPELYGASGTAGGSPSQRPQEGATESPSGELSTAAPALAPLQIGASGGDSVHSPSKPCAADPLAPFVSVEESKLNKTESAYLAYLRALKVPSLRIQAITLKLAFDCRLTVDFTYVNSVGRMTFVDVKGFQREDALIKMRVAARLFPEFQFVIVKKRRAKEGGGWEEAEVQP